MRMTELASRYARAAYEIAVDHRNQEKVLAELREIDLAFSKDTETRAFLTSPLIKIEEREAALAAALGNKGLSKESLDLILLLTRKDRLGIFSEVVHAYEAEIDSANNVCRGTVRSSIALGQAERERIEQTVEKVLNKKVIMTYKVDPTVIGGLVAQVGSYTFDDSIATHLKRMNEELKRRTV